MSEDARLAALRERHEALDRMIADEARRPGTEDLRMQELKREKLRLRDEIQQASPKEH